MATAIIVGFGLTLANFAYQGLTAHDWMLALERSWFQLTACFAMVGTEYILRRSVGGA